MQDFIEVYPSALSAAVCTQIVGHLREHQDQLQPGRVGSGVFPDLKRSRDVQITGQAAWQQVEAALNTAMLGGLCAYLRAYPQVLISPLMLQHTDAQGQSRRLSAEDVSAMDDAGIGQLLQACLRPGAINLQWYTADEGGYPYWHCELYPRDRNCECLHRHLLWTIYLNDGFDEGETEFFFQRRKVKPSTGDLLIAPAGFTHTHRGNRPRGGDKFIATSWILFERAERLYPAS